MKINYLILLFLLFKVGLFAQNNDFTNAKENKLWSDAENWSLKVVPDTLNTAAVRLPLLVESMVDLDVSVKKIQNLFGTAGRVSVAGDKTLTINPKAANAIGIENVSNNNTKLSFKGKVTISNSAGFTRLKHTNGTANIIEFEDGSLLTLKTPLEVFSGSSNDFKFNGKIVGSANLRLAANTESTFGKTSSNDGYLGEIVFLLNSKLIVNTADDSIFYNGPKLQVNGNNASIVLNGANVFASSIIVGGANTFTVNANKNQSNMRNIGFSANGILNLVVADSVTNLSFKDNSELDWNAGTLKITGFKDGVIRFGTDNKALTETQLSKIMADNDVKNLALDSNGYLVDKSTLSNITFESKVAMPIIQSTLTSNTLNFNTPQDNVRIVDLNGRVVFNKRAQHLSEVDINFLLPGLYFAIFDNNKVERFIKN